jgi:riboflavin synthase
MFTGIVEEVGEVISAGSELSIRATFRVEEGESVAVNGCCLTHVGGDPLRFHLSEETLRRTTLGSLRVGDRVNLERALPLGGRLGGHLVSGHVDAVTRVLEVSEVQGGRTWVVEIPEGCERYFVDKGSVALDGVSLTVVRPQEGRFEVALVPYTLERTTLGRLEAGARLNVEFDLIARYLEGLLAPYRRSSGYTGGQTE